LWVTLRGVWQIETDALIKHEDIATDCNCCFPILCFQYSSSAASESGMSALISVRATMSAMASGVAREPERSDQNGMKAIAFRSQYAKTSSYLRMVRKDSPHFYRTNRRSAIVRYCGF
jgi:hypothetical protein